MPPITALLHTMNDALRLGRALETLLPCTEIVVVDHQSTDATVRIARRYGARVVAAHGAAPDIDYLEHTRCDWIFCIEPGESMNEGLQTSLFEWAEMPSYDMNGMAGRRAFSVRVREQIQKEWLDLPFPETRLIPRGWNQWQGRVPASGSGAITLDGELLRFVFP